MARELGFVLLLMVLYSTKAPVNVTDSRSSAKLAVTALAS